MSTTVESRQDRVQSAPYVAFATFKNFIESLSKTGLPSRLDKSVMNGLSGGVQSHLVSALRFLGLVEENLSPTDAMEELVNSYGKDSWQDTLSAMLKTAYVDVTHGIDLEKATPHQLDKCFEKDSQSAVMVDKTVRFYLSALQEAGVKFSPHLEKRKPKAKRKTSVKAKPPVKEQSDQPQEFDVPENVPVGMIEYPIHLKGGRKGCIRVPRDITADDCAMIELFLPMLKMLSIPKS